MECKCDNTEDAATGERNISKPIVNLKTRNTSASHREHRINQELSNCSKVPETKNSKENTGSIVFTFLFTLKFNSILKADVVILPIYSEL